MRASRWLLTCAVGLTLTSSANRRRFFASLQKEATGRRGGVGMRRGHACLSAYLRRVCRRMPGTPPPAYRSARLPSQDKHAHQPPHSRSLRACAGLDVDAGKTGGSSLTAQTRTTTVQPVSAHQFLGVDGLRQLHSIRALDRSGAALPGQPGHVIAIVTQWWSRGLHVRCGEAIRLRVRVCECRPENQAAVV